MIHTIGVVGPCTAGKSTLIAGLRTRGIVARHIAQEHSYVADMWQRLTNPEALIYLSVSFPVSLQRRKMNWNEAEYQEQLHRLRHARQNASLLIDTDHLAPAEILEQVIAFLEQAGLLDN